jgi:hypothetical protein
VRIGDIPRATVLHAWPVEDLPGGRVRILTKETRIGCPAAELIQQTPNPMLTVIRHGSTGLSAPLPGRLAPERAGWTTGGTPAPYERGSWTS